MDENSTRPLGVDLDGTLVRTDILGELLIGLAKKDIPGFFCLPFWFLKGKAVFKAEISKRVDLDPTHLPFNERFLEHLKQEKRKGRRLVLVTAETEAVARKVSGHLGLFDDVFCSTPSENLCADRKAKLLVARFGEKGFDYAGNNRSDLKVWEHAFTAIAVESPGAVTRSLRKRGMDVVEFASAKHRWKDFLRAFRAHHWVKNVLFFVPAAAAHRLLEPQLFRETFIAFCAFGFCASAGYILNDLFDLEADRRHSRKKERPFATGRLSVWNGMVLVPVLLAVGLALGGCLPAGFVNLLAAYLLATFIYSFVLKRLMIVDVIFLAMLYAFRVFVGAYIGGVPISNWFMAFSVFFFFSLALAKRVAEFSIPAYAGQAEGIFRSRGYTGGDLSFLQNLAVSSGCLSVLVLALYVSSREVVALYSRPKVLWFICPFLLYWINRVLLIAHRGQMRDDPVVFAIKDFPSYVVGACIGLLLLLAV